MPTAKTTEVKEKIASSCRSIATVNAKFAESELRSSSDGGHYASENIQTYCNSLAAIDQHTEAAMNQQNAQLKMAVASLAHKVRIGAQSSAPACVGSPLPV